MVAWKMRMERHRRPAPEGSPAVSFFVEEEKMASSVRSACRWGLWSACVVLAVASAAWGNLTTVQVTGVVTNSSFPTIGIDSLFTGLYAYDDALVPYVDASGIAWYRPVAVSVVFADHSSLSTNEGKIMLHNDHVSGTDKWDIYAVGFDNIPVGSGTQTGVFAPYSAHGWMVALRDPTGTAWDSLALPDPEIVGLLPNDDSSLLFDFEGGGTGNYLFLHVTDLSVVAVPLPGAIVLGAVGLACFRPLLRRRLR